MKVLHVDLGRTMRGGQHQVAALLRRLPPSVESRLLTRCPELLEFARQAGVRSDAWSWAAFPEASRWASVVHAHDAAAHSRAAVWCPSKLVVSRRVAFPVSQTPLSRWKYGRAARYAAVSELAALELRHAGVVSSRISIVPDGVELPEQTTDYTGGIVALDTTDAGKLPELVDEVERLSGLPVYRSADLTTAFLHARLFLYLSRCEGFGSAALLANAYGVPVMASDVGGLREAIRDGMNGWLVPNDALAISDRLLQVSGDADGLRVAGRRGRDLVSDCYSAELLAIRTAELYRQVLEDRALNERSQAWSS
jgi:hypothetical protein